MPARYTRAELAGRGAVAWYYGHCGEEWLCWRPTESFPPSVSAVRVANEDESALANLSASSPSLGWFLYCAERRAGSRTEEWLKWDGTATPVRLGHTRLRLDASLLAIGTLCP